MERDLDKLKEIAYIRAFGKVGKDDDDFPPMDWEELIDLFKSTLCYKKRILTKDPIWDSYTEEEIIIEYFETLFHENYKFADKFKLEYFYKQTGVDFADWTDKELKKEELDDLPENFVFVPPHLDSKT